MRSRCPDTLILKKKKISSTYLPHAILNIFLTGHVEPGIPKPSLPPFSSINPNTNETVTFPEIMSDIGIGVVMVPFIATLDHIAIVSAFAKGRTFDATQEIITLGISTLSGSFFG